MSRRHGTLDGGEGLYWLIVGLWFLLCALGRGVRWLFCFGMSHARKDEPPPDYIPRARAAPSFEAYNDYVNRVLQKRVEEPSVTCPELLGEDDEEPREKVECEVVRDPDGGITLRLKEPSRYHRKLIPPGSFNRRS